MTKISVSPLETLASALPSTEHVEVKSEKSYYKSLSVDESAFFECLMNKAWVYVPPSLAIYDLSFSSSIEAIMESLGKGVCLKGVSGTMYRLTNKPRECMSH